MEWKQYLGLAPFFLSASLALALALSYRALKKRWARRSPLASRQIGHVPGQQLVERISDHETEILTSVMLMYMALPAMFMAWAGMRIDWDEVQWGFSEWLMLTAAGAMFAYGLYSYAKHLNKRDQARDGLLAERVTGMQLNRLIGRGCFVMHDLPAEGFNIDHIVIAPRGVYAVETKSFRKPRDASADRSDPSHHVRFDGKRLRFPDFNTAQPIEQAQQQAQWLQRYLREALGMEISVTPAVALPGWFVVSDEQIWRSASVKVFTPMGEGANFMAKDIARLDMATRSLVVSALAQRFPVGAT